MVMLIFSGMAVSVLPSSSAAGSDGHSGGGGYQEAKRFVSRQEEGAGSEPERLHDQLQGAGSRRPQLSLARRPRCVVSLLMQWEQERSRIRSTRTTPPYLSRIFLSVLTMTLTPIQSLSARPVICVA